MRPPPPPDWTAQAIVALRTRLGMTQRDFAHRVGVEAVTLRRWEEGKTTPRVAKQHALDVLRRGER